MNASMNFQKLLKMVGTLNLSCQYHNRFRDFELVEGFVDIQEVFPQRTFLMPKSVAEKIVLDGVDSFR